MNKRNGEVRGDMNGVGLGGRKIAHNISTRQTNQNLVSGSHVLLINLVCNKMEQVESEVLISKK